MNENAHRRSAGQQSQQNQGDETTEALRRQIRLLEEKLRKTRIAERPLDEPKVKIFERRRRQMFSFVVFLSGRTNASTNRIDATANQRFGYA